MTRTSAKKIILAGTAGDLASLARPLSESGLDVRVCPDGAKALELALTSDPELIVVDSDIPLIPAPKLFHILRSNPRTEGLAFFFLGREGEEAAEGFRRHKDLFLTRPFPPDHLLREIRSYITRKERTEQVSRQEKEIEGNLHQISLFDLLQIFSVNRKSGVLSLARDDQRGEIHLADGAVVNARTGAVEGEKAFYRLITWKQGKFWFAPGSGEREVRIRRPTDHLIMEGLRQFDEMAALAEALPAPGEELELKIPAARLPRGLRPATQEVLLVLQYYRRVTDILDHCPRPDFETLQILKVLLDKGLVQKKRPDQAPVAERTPLLNSEEILAIKDRLGERDILLEEASAKVVLLAASASDARRFAQSLQGLPEFEPEQDVVLNEAVPGLGEIGRLVVGESFVLRLVCLPVEEAMAPLWHPFCRRLFGVVSFSNEKAARRAEEFFKLAANVPVVRVSFEEDEEQEFPLRRGDRKSLQRLIGFFAAYYTGKLLPEEDA